MKKQSIPLIIILMLIALGGITYIQIRWINQSIREKQTYIDNLVQQAIVNVDKRLSDLNRLSVFHNQTRFEFENEDSLVYITAYDSLIAFPPTPPKMIHWHPSVNKDIQVLQLDDSTQITTEIKALNTFTQLNDSIALEINEIETELNELHEVRTIIEQIKIEKNNMLSDWRLDSNALAFDIKKELNNLSLDTLINFGIYDSQNNSYKIIPTDSNSIAYKIPLFKNDFINPGKYILHLSLVNNNHIIWRDIKTMVALSLIFILIILSVFIYAVKQIIKHKKISAIKSDFINNMTHEFKTPLATITLAADSILHESIIHNPEKIKNYTSIIQHEKNKLNENVERILEIAKLEKDQLTISSETISINNCIQNAIDSISLLLQRKFGTIEFIAHDSINIKGDKFHLTQALKNMLENSINYCNQKPEIKIEVISNNNHVSIIITDNGIGMTHAQIGKIFDPFYRVQSGDVHETKGFGLGLSYSQSIIQKMKGTIQVKSKINTGTIIEIKFEKA